MRSNPQGGETVIAQFELRVGRAELGIVRGRAAEETRALVRGCISQGSDSLVREFPAHLIPRFSAKRV
jgi:hypothetical protein